MNMNNQIKEVRKTKIYNTSKRKRVRTARKLKLVLCIILLVIGVVIGTQLERSTTESFAKQEPEVIIKEVIIEVEKEVLPPTVEEVKIEIRKQARHFGVNEDMMVDLADCESDFIWNAKNKTSTARGVYQYLIGTWEETVSAKQGLERNNIEANIREAMLDILSGESWRWRDCGIELRAMGYNF